MGGVIHSDRPTATIQPISDAFQGAVIDRLLSLQGFDREGPKPKQRKNGRKLSPADRRIIASHTHVELEKARAVGESLYKIARGARLGDTRALHKLRLAPGASDDSHLNRSFGPHFRLACSIAKVTDKDLDGFLINWLQGTQLLADAVGSAEQPDAIAWVVRTLRAGVEYIASDLGLVTIYKIVEGNYLVPVLDAHQTIQFVSRYPEWLVDDWKPRIPLFRVPRLSAEIGAFEIAGFFDTSTPKIVSLTVDWDRDGLGLEAHLRFDPTVDSSETQCLLLPLNSALLGLALADKALCIGDEPTWTSIPLTCEGTLSGGFSRGPEGDVHHVLGVLETALRRRMPQEICDFLGITPLLAAVEGRPARWPGDHAMGPIEHLWLISKLIADEIHATFKTIQKDAERERHEILRSFRIEPPEGDK